MTLTPPSWMQSFNIQTNVPLAPLTTIKAGGNADFFFQPASEEELIQLFKKKPVDFGTIFLGAGSNMLVRDGGLEGLVISLKNLTNVSINGTEITAQAGATCGKVARAARDEQLQGLSFLCGVPGSIGGALRMNAGCYGQETYNYLKECKVLTPKGEVKTFTPAEVGYGYRHTNLPNGHFFLSATFSLTYGNKTEIKDKMKQINAERRTSQPLEMPSSGSWFKNPINPKTGEKTNAWKVVDAAGCRGWQVGGAQVSKKHCNFFVNTGNAQAADFEELSAKVEAEILQKLDIKMEREAKIIGRKNA